MLIPFYHRGTGPPRGNSREFFSAHFWSCSRFSRNKRLCAKLCNSQFCLSFFFWVRLVRGVLIFEPLGKKLLGRHALGGDFGGLSLDFGYQRMKKKREKVYCLQGANPVYHRGKGPLGGTLAIFFSAFLELFQIFKKQTFMCQALQLPILFLIFAGVRLVRGVQIFEPLGKKLLGRHALGGDFGGLSLDFGYQRMKKKREKIHCLQGANPVLPQGDGPPRGNSREFFQRIFGVVPDLQETNVYAPNFATPNFVYLFFGVRLVRGVQIFEPLGKKLLGRHALGGDFGGLSLDIGYQRMKKKREKIHCLQGANPCLPQGKGPLGGTLANFFSAFLELFQIFKKRTFMRQTLQLPILFIFFFG